MLILVHLTHLHSLYANCNFGSYLYPCSMVMK